MKLTKFEIIIIILILGLGALFLTKDNLSLDNVPKIESLRKNKDYKDKNDKNENENESDFDEGEIEVHIDGRVKNPGVYKIKKGTRLKDLIDEAGGLLDDAKTSNLNLARKLKDEEKITIKSYLDKDEEDSKININTASKDMLTSIPGVGSKMADKIIKYRQEHPFNTIEDLLNITGIGKKKFEEIKLYITTD
ncbi:ComEA family DNA-binding protein [Peptoniphilus sp. BV3AC2]|uniref:ComEA family DNA-binding protein n=1 Tax=Peptoniphilus sp. BV3AC2 TaxID=1111133 RepID=UPI0003B9278C|nr:ComEA family DNA-binding protein [Peptoniphilus sp. BV3AC2]ERT64967.1 type II secretion system protein K-like protein [Peptoniphilus sp. BV3AC2]